MNLVLFIVIGLIAGALAGRVVSGDGYGVLGDIVLGVIGAFLGGWIFVTFLGVGGGGILMSLVTAFIGAIALLWLIRLGRSEARLVAWRPARRSHALASV